MANVKISTTLGEIVVHLYDETPKHRDNFLKLASESYYDNCLFHRVIKGFMVQGGDPDSKSAKPGVQYGTGGPNYTIEAEIKPNLYHKRGALAAARTGDEVNPERRSSGSQFYIVWGDVYAGGKLTELSRQMEMMAAQSNFSRLAAENKKKIMELRRNRNQEGLLELQNELAAKAQAMAKEQGGLNEDQKKIYSTIGGTPHLDGQYTVFGEVIKGLDVVEKIQSVQTLRGDRPCEDITMTISICE